MVPDRQRIVGDALQDRGQVLARDGRGVRHSGPIDEIARIEHEEVDAARIRQRVQVLHEAHQIAVVGVHALVAVAGDEAVDVGQVQQVDAPPLDRGSDGGGQRRRTIALLRSFGRNRRERSCSASFSRSNRRRGREQRRHRERSGHREREQAREQAHVCTNAACPPSTS